MKVFSPNEFICLAEELAEDEREAWLRAAISRAYYGVFLIAREAMNVTTRDGRAHRETSERLKKHKMRMGLKLSQLHGLRKKADYVLDVKVNQRMAADAMDAAWYLHRRLLRMKGEKARQHERMQLSEGASA